MHIRKIGVILRPSTPSLGNVYFGFKEIAEKHSIEVNIDSMSGEMIGIYGVEFSKLCQWCDILVTLGGDGTLISALRRSFFYNKPILGINTGRLGFLTAIGLDELPVFMEKLKNDEYVVQSQMILEGEFSQLSDNKKLHCVNEFLISKQDISGMIKIIAKINGKHFNTYFSDGLIIGTPAGSTAYNISAGGSVVYPYTRNILLTPICAHSLTQRPLILSDEFILEFEMQDSRANLVIDGQEILPFNENDKLKIYSSKSNSLLIYDRKRDYFEVLRQKFSWGV
ncbi:NAD(+) kinase [Helicobacter sp. 16-1353]|uniref:NAD(+)/NADH kinase n=1 Tax=Helicobacter sp. 16-1353 TaxID=2004996 RepID=UPI000DCCE98C|nr:NAD(+)/NADH kinase [Helicobacter sp. 16-1353]RAX54997.1 NAD(+) kinase [Helicobacter sp. 16-1353]